ncbi:DJ-1/PfpI/YhbO family deglycase/protease [Nocardiopsis coralliicola]
MSVEGKRVLVIVSNQGVEQDELVKPVEALEAAGAQVTIAAQRAGTVRSLVHDWELGAEVDAEAALADVAAGDFDAVVVPGGTINADNLRRDTDAQRLVTDTARAGRPVAAVCHAPWLIIDAGLAAGRTLTSYGTLQTDLSNAGAEWVDREVVVDTGGGFTLITSRNPGDLDAFTAAISDALGG